MRMKYYGQGEIFEDYSVSAFLLYTAVEVKKEAEIRSPGYSYLLLFPLLYLPYI